MAKSKKYILSIDQGTTSSRGVKVPRPLAGFYLTQTIRLHQ